MRVFYKIWIAATLVSWLACFGFVMRVRERHQNNHEPKKSEYNPPKYGQSVGLLIAKNNAIPPSEEEYALKVPCSFLIRTVPKANVCTAEAEMHKLIRKFLPLNSVVMEVGARYGSSSCLIANMQGNSGRLVAVEPDITAIPDLVGNQISHYCNFHIVVGAVTEKPMYLARSQYFTTRIAPINGTEGVNVTRIPNFPWESVEQILGLKVDTLIVDCEGCEIPMFEEYFEKKHHQLKAIMVEWHGHLPKDSLKKWLDKFEKAGFALMANNKDAINNHLAIIRVKGHV